MTSTAPPLSSASPLVSPTDASAHSSSAPPNPQPGAQTPSRLSSRLSASQENPNKRLSTASNPSREAPPTPDHAPPPTSNPTSPPAGAAKQASPRNSPAPAEASNPSSPPSSRHKTPSFPPPQASRISVMSISSNNRDSWHPQFASSLAYTSVRDFAYPALHPLHYGPSLSSGIATPASQRASGYFESGSGASGWYHAGGRRLSDPAQPSDAFGWDDVTSPRQRPSNQPPPLNFSDGPPWSEDEDLQSPVVMPKHGHTHRKHKSTTAHMQSHQRHQSKNAFTPTTLHHFAGSREEKDWDRPEVDNGLSSSRGYYTRFSNASELADGEPGGELYRHPEENEYDPDNPGYYHDQEYSDGEGDYDDDSEFNARFSTDYQFTIASPDEEMHGKAIALFDFARENENELPLVEGQMVLVSYRHGMGWLVAEDPRTGESGLVPEEYVRLFKFMQPDAAQEMNPSLLAEVAAEGDRPVSPSISNNGHQAPIISTFSTTSEDMSPLPLQHHRHPDEYYAHINTPTTPSTKDRLEQIRREQDQAVREMIDSDTPRLGSARFEVQRANGKSEDKKSEEAKKRPVSTGAVESTPRKSGENDVFFDAREEQGVDFREK